MKLYEYKKYSNYLNKNDLANMFNVIVDKHGYAKYNINSTLEFINLKDIPLEYFTTHQIRANDTLMTVAQKYYGDLRLAWLVAKSNDLTNMFTRLEPDKKLRILNKDLVDSIIEAL